MFDLNNILRENIRGLVPYSSARNEFTGSSGIFLDANENSFGSASGKKMNRYPDPLQRELKKKLSSLKNVPDENIFMGNGSDEAIDLVLRAFCNPGVDNVLVCPPTYGMYEVAARINDVGVKKVLLTGEYQLNLNDILDAVDQNTKLIFICSPNNPTGNLISKGHVHTILSKFKGIVVLDEAYIDFSPQGSSMLKELQQFPNLFILQTFSKAWGMANIRMGMAFADEQIIKILNKIKLPYNVNGVTQQIVMNALDNTTQVNTWIMQIKEQRGYLTENLKKLPFVLKVYPSDANFILVKTTDARMIYNYLVENGLIVRDRSKVELCEGALRITVGTGEENKILLGTLRNY